jgi:hypothetical protein
MEFPNTLPITDFAPAISVPSNQSSSAVVNSSNSSLHVSQSVATRKSKDEGNGIFHPVRRTFTVPVAVDDVQVYESVRNAILFKHMKMSQKQKEEEEKEISTSLKEKGKSELEEAIEKERERLEIHIEYLKTQKQSTLDELERAKKKAHQAQQDLVSSIKKRDQEIKQAKENPPRSAMEDEVVRDLIKQKDELCAKVKKLEQELQDLEDKWTTEDAERSQRLAQELQERKRKAAEQMEEQKRKKQKLLQEAEMTESKRLEQELKVGLNHYTCRLFCTMTILKFSFHRNVFSNRRKN